MREITWNKRRFYILTENDPIPSGEVWFRETEWDFAKRLGKNCELDPESKRAFWNDLFERKNANHYYSLFDDFPLDVDGPVPQKQPVGKFSSKGEMARFYGSQILAKLGQSNVEKK